MANVDYANNVFVVKTEYWDNDRAKQAPARKWDPKSKRWLMPPTTPNAMYLRREFEDFEVEPDAEHAIHTLLERPKPTSFPAEYKFTHPPMEHQAKALNACWGLKEYALFFEMRLGKTFTAINLGQARYQCGQIEQMLIICPTPIKMVWEGEFDKFAPDTDVFTLESGRNKPCEHWIKDRDGTAMKAMIVGVEALSQGTAWAMAQDFVRKANTFCVIDESSRIKNHKSARTERCIDLGGDCEYRMILTGTPSTQGLHDLYPQFAFLNWSIIGQKSFYTFRNRYCIMGGYQGRAILAYRNSNELMKLVEPYSMVVKTKEVYDMPKMEPQARWIKPSPEQKKMFIELKHEFSTIYGEDELVAETMLERMTRYQQINGGNFPCPVRNDKEEISWETRPLLSNPKLDELENMLDEIGDQSAIIWARFVPEIDAICEMLEKHGKGYVPFYGAVNAEDRKTAVEMFQAGSAQFFVGNQAVGGMGIKLSKAEVMIYYSNTFSYEDRVQSMARSQEIGRKVACATYDLVLTTEIDRAIMAAQLKKGGMAEYLETNIKRIKEEM